jgi:hypothetical protein
VRVKRIPLIQNTGVRSRNKLRADGLLQRRA